MAEFVKLTEFEVWEIAARMPGDAVALVLALESHGVGSDAFRLPTEHLVRVNFLPGWSRQNYRTALTNALAMGLFDSPGAFYARPRWLSLPPVAQKEVSR